MTDRTNLPRPAASPTRPSRALDRAVQVGFYIAGLVFVYAVVLVSFQPWDLAMGALLAAGLLWLGRHFIFVGPPIPVAAALKRIAMFPVFALAVAWEIVVGTWVVALIVLKIRPLRSPGIVAIPMGERTRLGVAATALATGLSPGTLLVDLDWEKRVMLIHFIDASDPEAHEAEMQRMYERYQRHVFP